MRAAAGVLALLFLAGACRGDGGASGTRPTTTAAPTTTPTTVPVPETTVAPALPLAARPRCTPARPHEPGLHDRSLAAGGATRRYVLGVPAGYDGSMAYPVVLMLHGFASNARQQIAYSDVFGLAEHEQFLVIALQGAGLPARFELVGEPGRKEVAFALEAVADAGRLLCTDESRVYAAGMSNGGGMSMVLGCRAPERFAAVGAVALLVRPARCATSRAVPLTAFMGTADPIVPFAGGPVACCGAPVIPPAQDSVAAWAAQAGCRPQPSVSAVGEGVERRRWQPCRNGAVVDFYVIDGGGHTWPGAPVALPGLGRTTKEVSATSVLWRFFTEHRLP